MQEISFYREQMLEKTKDLQIHSAIMQKNSQKKLLYFGSYRCGQNWEISLIQKALRRND